MKYTCGVQNGAYRPSVTIKRIVFHFRESCLLTVCVFIEHSPSLSRQVLTFITFVCFVASSAAVFTTAPLVEFLMAIFFYFAYSTKFNERFKDFYWPLVDFLRCVTASIIYFIISIISVSKYSGGASSAAGVFGFIATIVFAIDFYFIFNDLATFLKQGRTPDEEPQAANDSDSDSD
uniref:CKLF-like MARVEL transmembrane domain containing 3 n=1 Tax=Paramormyrops kingsleyae TaxID=1676925 RepID=A0A3B3S0M5_9TELE